LAQLITSGNLVTVGLLGVFPNKFLYFFVMLFWNKPTDETAEPVLMHNSSKRISPPELQAVFAHLLGDRRMTSEV